MPGQHRQPIIHEQEINHAALQGYLQLSQAHLGITLRHTSTTHCRQHNRAGANTRSTS